MRNADVLQRSYELAVAWLRGLPGRHVGARLGRDALLARLGGPLPEAGSDPISVLESFASAADPGLVATPGPRYFGYVIGATLPVALAADWLTSAWDQNAAQQQVSPASAAVEEVTIGWLLELLGLPTSASAGLVTGGQTANFTALLAARNEVYARAGWDVERDGLIGAPPLRVVAGAEAHASIFAALRMLGLGTGHAQRVEADSQGRMIPEELKRILNTGGQPTIVCAQAGNVNSGAFDPLEEISKLAREHGAWLHVDGAFGLWALASAHLRWLARGAERADSWSIDAHKWLNVPYDCGIALTAHPRAHRAATTASAAYLEVNQGPERHPFEWVPEHSRRARANSVYVAMRTLGRSGIAALVDRCCALATRMAEQLSMAPGVRVLNEVVLNQVLVRIGDSDERTRSVISRVQEQGTCWLGGTTWQGQTAIRISVSSHSTTEEDADRSVRAILEAAA